MSYYCTETITAAIVFEVNNRLLAGTWNTCIAIPIGRQYVVLTSDEQQKGLKKNRPGCRSEC